MLSIVVIIKIVAVVVTVSIADGITVFFISGVVVIVIC